MSSWKWQPFCLGINVLSDTSGRASAAIVLAWITQDLYQFQHQKGEQDFCSEHLTPKDIFDKELNISILVYYTLTPMAPFTNMV